MSYINLCKSYHYSILPEKSNLYAKKILHKEPYNFEIILTLVENLIIEQKYEIAYKTVDKTVEILELEKVNKEIYWKFLCVKLRLMSILSSQEEHALTLFEKLNKKFSNKNRPAYYIEALINFSSSYQNDMALIKKYIKELYQIRKNKIHYTNYYRCIKTFLIYAQYTDQQDDFESIVKEVEKMTLLAFGNNQKLSLLINNSIGLIYLHKDLYNKAITYFLYEEKVKSENYFNFYLAECYIQINDLKRFNALIDKYVSYLIKEYETKFNSTTEQEVITLIQKEKLAIDYLLTNHKKLQNDIFKKVIELKLNIKYTNLRIQKLLKSQKQNMDRRISRINNFLESSVKKKINTDSLLQIKKQLERLQTKSFKGVGYISMKEIMKKIKKDECLLIFSEYIDKMNFLNNQQSYCLIITNNDVKIVLLNLNSINTLSEDKKLSTTETTETRGTSINKNMDRHNLYLKIWLPLEPYLKEMKTINYITDGSFNNYNFDSFKINNSKYVIDLYNLNKKHSIYSPFKEIKMKKLNNLNFCLIGNIFYSSDKSDRLDSEILPNLPFSKKEIYSVKKILSKKNIKAEIFEGKVTDSLLKNHVLLKNDVIHIAAHSYIGETSKSNQSTTVSNSGIILSLTNNIDEKYNKLEYSEIKNSVFKEKELVILNSCLSGKGDQIPGEGLTGLQYAFFASGAKRLIVTNTSVKDNFAYEFIKLFYQNWITEKNSIRKAYKKAKLKMRVKYPDNPENWESYMLIN
ncbi:CHAT domain-containing protein [Tenacibaculum sediminilitoris]|uniref:CHAT domain-containing protein n=1 Tax=Tenacibaculum sediminilitoris TaxID=1820334 RepID=UPI0038B69F7D